MTKVAWASPCTVCDRDIRVLEEITPTENGWAHTDCQPEDSLDG